MRNATINLDYYQVPAEQMPTVEMPQFLLELAEGAKDYLELKSEMLEIFTTYFHSEQFKERIDTEISLMLFNELNDMFDNIYLAQIECKKIILFLLPYLYLLFFYQNGAFSSHCGDGGLSFPISKIVL